MKINVVVNIHLFKFLIIKFKKTFLEILVYSFKLICFLVLSARIRPNITGANACSTAHLNMSVYIEIKRRKL
jgi:hypothetical protein